MRRLAQSASRFSARQSACRCCARHAAAAPLLIPPTQLALQHAATSGPAPRFTLGYISRRFEEYPGTQLMLRLFGAHNRSRVRVRGRCGNHVVHMLSLCAGGFVGAWAR